MNGTIARLTLSNLMRGWRGPLLALLPLSFLFLAAVSRYMIGVNDQAINGLLDGLNLVTIVPLMALIIGTGALATEIDDGSIIYMLTKPINRHTIIATKLGVAVAVGVGLTGIPTLVAGVLLTGTLGDAAMAYTMAAVISTILYSALFIMLSAVSRHAVVIGLVYVLLWEGLFIGLVGGARVLSIQHWAASMTSQVFGDVMEADVNGILATVLAVTAFVAMTWFAGSRLRSLSLAKEA